MVSRSNLKFRVSNKRRQFNGCRSKLKKVSRSSLFVVIQKAVQIVSENEGERRLKIKSLLVSNDRKNLQRKVLDEERKKGEKKNESSKKKTDEKSGETDRTYVYIATRIVKGSKLFFYSKSYDLFWLVPSHHPL